MCAASSSRWKAISMAAAFRPRRRLTVFCPVLRAACTYGSESILSGSDPRRRAVRLCCGVAGRISKRVTCSLGAHLNTRQFRQLCDSPRTVYLTFDADDNGSGQQAAQRLSRSLQERGISTRRVSLPDGHDPNSFFVQGGDAQQFQRLLEAALP